MTLGKTIRAARTAAEMTLDDLAGELDIAEASLSNIERDRSIPSEDLLRRLALALNLDADELRAMAGKLTEEEWAFVKRTPSVVKLLGAMMAAGFGGKEVEKLVKQVEKKR